MHDDVDRVRHVALGQGADLVIVDRALDRTVFYTTTLAVPARRSVADRVVRSGEQAFGPPRIWWTAWTRSV